jgi:hypothetical protein
MRIPAYMTIVPSSHPFMVLQKWQSAAVWKTLQEVRYKIWILLYCYNNTLSLTLTNYMPTSQTLLHYLINSDSFPQVALLL